MSIDRGIPGKKIISGLGYIKKTIRKGVGRYGRYVLGCPKTQDLIERIKNDQTITNSECEAQSVDNLKKIARAAIDKEKTDTITVIIKYVDRTANQADLFAYAISSNSKESTDLLYEVLKKQPKTEWLVAVQHTWRILINNNAADNDLAHQYLPPPSDSELVLNAAIKLDNPNWINDETNIKQDFVDQIIRKNSKKCLDKVFQVTDNCNEYLHDYHIPSAVRQGNKAITMRLLKYNNDYAKIAYNTLLNILEKDGGEFAITFTEKQAKILKYLVYNYDFEINEKIIDALRKYNLYKSKPVTRSAL